MVRTELSDVCLALDLWGREFDLLPLLEALTLTPAEDARRVAHGRVAAAAACLLRVSRRSVVRECGALSGEQLSHGWLGGCRPLGGAVCEGGAASWCDAGSSQWPDIVVDCGGRGRLGGRGRWPVVVVVVRVVGVGREGG